MVDFLISFSQNTWQLIAEMAVYLLFGFAVAGCLHILIRPERVRKLLGKPGIGTVIKACLVGVPMPLCSCSVIPVAASLRKSGASRGATASFLSSTPQTGVDSIFATYALMGGAFTIVRVIVAFISGIVSGVLVDLFAKEKPVPKPAVVFTPLAQKTDATAATFTSFTAAPVVETTKSCCSPSTKPKPGVCDVLRYGFVTLPADLANALLVGLILGGLITTVLPDDLLSGAFSSGPLAFLLATLISLPLYICATASIPLAYALIAAGLSPGAALILLIVGPATNTATVVAVWKLLGRNSTLIYIGTLIVISWIAGALFNTSIRSEQMSEAIHHHELLRLAAWQHVCGIALLLLLGAAIVRKRLAAASQRSCCMS
ncbi:MAG: SO_0444 family Cu/Zn efflux transporter [Opitutaceae bacterium]